MTTTEEKSGEPREREAVQAIRYLNEGGRIQTERIPMETFDDHDIFIETERNAEKYAKGVFVAVIRKKDEETLGVDIGGVVIDVKAGKQLRLGRETGQNPLWYHWESAAQISRRHCEIRWEGDEIIITDLGSRNGTCLKLVPRGTSKPFTIASGKDHTEKPEDLGGPLDQVLARVRKLVKDFLGPS